MHPRDLTPVEIADLLDAAYREDRGLGDGGPDTATRLELASYLGGHPEVEAQAWEVWQALIAFEDEVDEDDAQFWLHVDFVELRPQ